MSSLNGVSYDEAQGIVVSAAEAEAEIAKHFADFADFQAEHGEAAEYRAAIVLDWLGY